MILSKLSGMVGHGSFPMKVVGLLQNNLVRTNHTVFYHVSTYIYIFIFHFCNLHVVMNSDGCDRLFSLQLFRTLPVGKIHRVPSGLCSLSIFFPLFYSTSSAYPPYATICFAPLCYNMFCILMCSFL